MNSRRFVVDRMEGHGPDARVVLIDDTSAQVVEVPAATLPRAMAEEGAVLAVPSGPRGPDWTRATRDRAEEARRRAEHKATLDGLRRRDPGGDLIL